MVPKPHLPPERMSLVDLGWGEFFETRFAPFREKGLIPARVAREERDLFGVYCEAGRLAAEVTGRMRHEARLRAELPAVGDWVAVEVPPGGGTAIIHAVLPRRSRISRRQPGEKTAEQVLAANVDTIFLVSALDGSRNYHLPTIERYVVMAFESGAEPVVLLNKCDLCDEFPARIAEVEAVAPGVAVHAMSALRGDGLDALRAHLGAGKTAVFLGRSGVGKSMLINRLVGRELLPVGEIRANDLEGRHTTTWREMILLPADGGIVIDTPGMRELQAWGIRKGSGPLTATGGAAAFSSGFDDIEEIALGCRFSDCRHLTEPACAVKAAVESGALDPARLERFHNLRQQAEHLARLQDEKARLNEKSAGRKMARMTREVNKHNPKRRTNTEER